MNPDIRIVVPSRQRVHNMPVLRSLLPTATICVDEREAAAYSTIVPKDKLLTHPPMSGYGRIMNWVMEVVKEPILVAIDDDFVRIQCLVGSKRRITNPVEILAVIENAARACQDLGLSTFCWTRTANTAMLHPEERPIMPIQPICNAYGLMGAARRRHYDPRFLGRADMDRTLETLLRDRAIYCDARFYFDCGKVFAGRGGTVGILTHDQYKASTKALQQKWGKWLTFKPPGFAKTRSVSPMRIAVSRRNPTAQK